MLKYYCFVIYYPKGITSVLFKTRWSSENQEIKNTMLRKYKWRQCMRNTEYKRKSTLHDFITWYPIFYQVHIARDDLDNPHQWLKSLVKKRREKIATIYAGHRCLYHLPDRSHDLARRAFLSFPLQLSENHCQNLPNFNDGRRQRGPAGPPGNVVYICVGEGAVIRTS